MPRRSGQDSIIPSSILTGEGFATPESCLNDRFIKIDKDIYGSIKGITDKENYTNSFHSPDDELDIKQKIKLEAEFQNLTLGGAISYIDISKCDNLEEMIKYIYDNIQYVEFKN